MDISKAVVVIPSFEPNKQFFSTVNDLKQAGFSQFVIVNDGSDERFNSFFQFFTEEPGCHVLQHPLNYGKGRALKTAFEFITGQSHFSYVVTVDSDGQHLGSDARQVVELLADHPDSLILGCRDFDTKGVPFKSRFGNKVSREILSWMRQDDSDKGISDTQTGLRAFSVKHLNGLLAIPGERFEYETNMLLASGQLGISVRETKISTVYFEGNKSTHFQPFSDSFKILKSIAKFSLASFISFLIDVSLFVFFHSIFQKITPASRAFLATVSARCISAVANYYLNKQFVFTIRSKSLSFPIKYASLFVTIMFLSGFLVSSIVKLWPLVNLVLVKICVDVSLFLVSFYVQKNFLFIYRSRRRNAF